MTYAPVSEDYSIGRPLTGDLLISHLRLTGWGAKIDADPDADPEPTPERWALDEISTRNRVFARYTHSTAILEIFADAAFTNLVASGEVVNGACALEAENEDFPLTGACRVAATSDGTCSIVLTYADERDLARRYVGLANELTTSGPYPGQGIRFEVLLLDGKRELDAKLAEDLAPVLPGKPDGTLDLSIVSDPRQDNIVRAHAGFCEASLYALRGALDMQFVEAERYRRKVAREELQSRRIALDYDGDRRVDGSQSASPVRLVIS